MALHQIPDVDTDMGYEPRSRGDSINTFSRHDWKIPQDIKSESKGGDIRIKNEPASDPELAQTEPELPATEPELPATEPIKTESPIEVPTEPKVAKTSEEFAETASIFEPMAQDEDVEVKQEANIKQHKREDTESTLNMDFDNDETLCNSGVLPDQMKQLELEQQPAAEIKSEPVNESMPPPLPVRHYQQDFNVPASDPLEHLVTNQKAAADTKLTERPRRQRKPFFQEYFPSFDQIELQKSLLRQQEQLNEDRRQIDEERHQLLEQEEALNHDYDQLELHRQHLAKVHEQLAQAQEQFAEERKQLFREKKQLVRLQRRLEIQQKETEQHEDDRKWKAKQQQDAIARLFQRAKARQESLEIAARAAKQAVHTVIPRALALATPSDNMNMPLAIAAAKKMLEDKSKESGTMLSSNIMPRKPPKRKLLKWF